MALSKPRATRIESQVDLKAKDPFVGWEIVDVQFPEEANTDLVIRHGLPAQQPRDVHYRVIKQFTGGSVYESVAADSKKWTNDFIVLRSDYGGWTGRILLGLLDRIDNFDYLSYDIPPTTDCCEDDAVEGTECQIACAEDPMLSAPAGADSVTLTPNSSSWADSDWVEIEAETAEAWILVSVTALVGTSAANNFFEIDIGVGEAGSEFPIATLSGLAGNDTGGAAIGDNILILPVPVDAIPSGSRVSARIRQFSTSVEDWKVAVNYYGKPLGEETILNSLTSGCEVWPSAAGPVTVAPNATAWVSGNWTEFVSATSTNWLLGGLTVIADNNTEWELDLGVGEIGEESVITTLRGSSRWFIVSDAWQGGFFNYLLRPALLGIQSGQRIALRFRSSGTSAVGAKVKAVFYRENLPAMSTLQPMQSYPSAANSLALNQPSSGVYGAWVEFTPSTDSEIAIVAVTPTYASTGDTTIQIGVGDSGSESPIVTLVSGAPSIASAGAEYIPLNVGSVIAAGQRVSMRMKGGNPGSTNRGFAISYIANPDFTQKDTTIQDVFARAQNTITGVWTNSTWAQVDASLATDIRLTAFYYEMNGGDVEGEFDIGVGASGFEQVVTTIRIAQTASASASGIRYQVMPVPQCVEGGQRLAIRSRTNAASGFVYLTLHYMEDTGPGDGTCGPDLEDDGSGSGGSTIVLPASSTNNAIVLWDGVLGNAIKNSGIIVSGSGALSGTNTGDQTITLTGDVTGSGTGSFAATIANDAVTFAKFQNITTARLLGRTTASSGNVEEISVGAGLSFAAGVLDTAGAAGVTTTGSPASGNLTKFSGAGTITNADLTGDVTTSGTEATTIAAAAVTYAKIQDVSAGSKLLGRGDSGSGDVQEITLGSGLAMTGTTLSASGSGVTTTGSPSAGNLTKFSAAGTITNANLSGDVTTTDTETTTIANDAVTYAKMQNVSAASRILGRGSAGGSGDVEEISFGSSLTLTGTVLNATAGSGLGDVVGPSSSVDAEIALFDSTTGKLLKRPTVSAVLTSGTLITAPGVALALTATVPTQVSGATAGVNASLTASAATTGSGSGTAAGGAINITAGNANGQTSGNNSGGAVNVVAGNASASSSNTGATGGAVLITAGNGAAQGAATTTGIGGVITLTGGVGSSIAAGGSVTCKGGAGSNSAGGAVLLTGGNAAGANGGLGGAITLTTGNGSGGGQNGGAITLTTGAGGTGASTGSVTITTGANVPQATAVTITAGQLASTNNGTGAAGGSIVVTAGAGQDKNAFSASSTGGAGANVVITGGNGGNVTGSAGTRTGGAAGNVTIAAGAPGTGTAANGAVGSITIATATTQKIGFWNTAAIAQPTNAIAAATFVANTSAIADDTATFDGYTLGQVVKALRNLGILA